MYLNAHEIAKALGISTETIRYYVREGLITPHKNEGNGYWEYSSEDLMKITDILFYRSMSLTIPDIKAIMTEELPLEELQPLLERRKNELIDEIRQKTEELHILQGWSMDHLREMQALGTYRIGPMPASYRRAGCYDSTQHMAQYLKSCFDFEKGNWGDVSLSFSYDMTAEPPRMERYLSFMGSIRLKPSNLGRDILVEQAERCLITEAHYSDDPMQMLAPMLDYAKQHDLALTGQFYGRENTNYFADGHRRGIYCLYAVLK